MKMAQQFLVLLLTSELSTSNVSKCAVVTSWIPESKHFLEAGAVVVGIFYSGPTAEAGTFPDAQSSPE